MSSDGDKLPWTAMVITAPHSDDESDDETCTAMRCRVAEPTAKPKAAQSSNASDDTPQPTFTRDQEDIMSATFKVNPYLTDEETATLAKQVDATPDAVRRWFSTRKLTWHNNGTGNNVHAKKRKRKDDEGAPPSGAAATPVSAIGATAGPALGATQNHASMLTSRRGKKFLHAQAQAHRRAAHKTSAPQRASDQGNVPVGDFEELVIDAIRMGNAAETARLLHIGQPDAEQFCQLVLDHSGHTPVHWAAVYGQAEIVKLLVNNGFKQDALNSHGESALHRMLQFDYCYRNRNFYEILCLIGLHCVGIVSVSGHTALHDLAYNLSDPTYHKPADYYIDVLLDLHRGGLVDLKLNQQDPDGDTVIGICAESTNVGFVKKLLDAGADPTIRNNKGDVPIDFASPPIKQLFQQYKTSSLSAKSEPGSEDTPAAATSTPSPASTTGTPSSSFSATTPTTAPTAMSAVVPVSAASAPSTTTTTSAAATQSQSRAPPVSAFSRDPSVPMSVTPPLLNATKSVTSDSDTPIPRTELGREILRAVYQLERRSSEVAAKGPSNETQVQQLHKQLMIAQERIRQLTTELKNMSQDLAFARGQSRELEQSMRRLQSQQRPT